MANVAEVTTIDLNINTRIPTMCKPDELFRETLPVKSVTLVDVSVTKSSKYSAFSATVSFNSDFQMFKSDENLNLNEINQQVMFPLIPKPRLNNEDNTKTAFEVNVLVPLVDLFNESFSFHSQAPLANFRADYTLRNSLKGNFVAIEVKQWNAFVNANLFEKQTKEKVEQVLQTGGKFIHLSRNESGNAYCFAMAINQLQAYLFSMNTTIAYGILSSYFHTYLVILRRDPREETAATLEISPVVKYCDGALRRIAEFIQLAATTENETVKTKIHILSIKNTEENLNQVERPTTRSLTKRDEKDKDENEQPNQKRRAGDNEHGSRKQKQLVTGGEYVLGNVIGYGRSGPVMKIFDDADHSFVIKCVGECKGVKCTEEEITSELKNETFMYEILRELQGDVMPHFYFSGYLYGCIYTLVLEELHAEPIRNRKHLSNEEKKAISCALDKIHMRGILHCDISPMNILIDRNNCAFFIDFAMSRKCNSKKAFRQEMRELITLLQWK